jgi:hypothetical protein
MQMRIVACIVWKVDWSAGIAPGRVKLKIHLNFEEGKIYAKQIEEFLDCIVLVYWNGIVFSECCGRFQERLSWVAQPR